MPTSTRSFLALGVFSVAFVFNPGYLGCTSADGPNFGEAEMLELLDEANATGPFELEHAGVHYRLELTLAQKSGEDRDDTVSQQPPAAFAARAYACGQRTFMASAAACSTTSTVPLTAEFSLVRLDPSGETPVYQDQALSGELRVGGNRLSNGRVELSDAAMDASIALHSNDGVHFELARVRLQIDGFPTTF